MSAPAKKHFDDATTEDEKSNHDDDTFSSSSASPAPPPAASAAAAVVAGYPTKDRYADPHTGSPGPAFIQFGEYPQAAEREAAGGWMAEKEVELPTPKQRASLTVTTSTPATVSKPARPNSAAQVQQQHQQQQQYDRRDCADKYASPADTPMTGGGGRHREERRGSTETHASPLTADPSQFSDRNGHRRGESGRGGNGSGGGARGPHEAAAVLFESYVAPYIFPRLDADLADWDDPERERVLPDDKLDDLRRHPPNCSESCCGYLLATDRRLALYLVVLVLAIIFTVVSIPTSQIDVSSGELLAFLGRPLELVPINNVVSVYNFSGALDAKSCYTYWGYKENCDAAIYTLPVSLIWCASVRSRLQASAAFAIMTLVVYLVLLFITVITVFCLTDSAQLRDKNRAKNTRARHVIAWVGIVAFIFHIIAWAPIAAVKSASYCRADTTRPDSPGIVLDDRYKAYGVGFGLSITAWAIHTVALGVLLFIPGSLANSV